MTRAFTEIAFTPTVLAEQERQGSARAYRAIMAPGAEPADRLGLAEARFVAARDGFYQATVSETGWPYVQFRGGPVGFLKVVDEKTLAYADFRGNRQYLSVGNLKADDRVALFLMDYPNRRRLKIWGRARLIDLADNPDLVASLHDPAYEARPERAVVITVAAFDWNCQKHIPSRLTLDELEFHLSPIRDELNTLRAENAALKERLAATA
ncbi:pyridoxamine 5'-phosphate oxidase family protein [Oceanibacterium hippocampi]|uniref:Pyridoxamine 5'-phosphate oxidase n=1 Tax=Oceanibacterium hippocampi TaxID=745714 RepID=A0A1Y5THV6_9PROT|nr:pyridoxamine 5'-phosphate oxidase family protein [Oceanibacterium hippocampi]SLN60705.1 Pyridoxamine 5'-phosphate oxidase [Oceanibacterium hippocampi]